MTNFPTTKDTTTTLPTESASTPLSTNHVTAHTNLADAIIALETKVGADSSAVTTTHDYKLSGVTSSDKAVSLTGSETLTNKTLTSPKITVGSDAVGDLHYTSNSNGTQSRLPIGTATQQLRVNAGATALEYFTPTAQVDASYAAKGVVQFLTDAATSGITVASGVANVNSGTGANQIVKRDSSGNYPSGNGSAITNVTPIVGSYVGAVYSDSSITTQNVDTTYTCNFTAKNITLYFVIQGADSSTSIKSSGIATFNGTTLTSVMYFVYQGTATAAVTNNTIAINNSTLTCGGTSGNSNTVTLTVQSVSSTQFVIRAAYLTTSSTTGSIAYYPVATQ